MARLRILIIAVVLGLVPVSAHGSPPGGGAADSSANAVSLETQVQGSTAWAYLDEHASTLFGGQTRRHIPIRNRFAVGCGRWSSWHLTGVTGAGARSYGTYIFDGCHDNAQIFPPGPNACNQDDRAHPSARFSTCVTIPPRTLVAGFTPQTCEAHAVVATSLDAAVTPATYDPGQSTPMSLTTSFGPEFLERLSEGFCTNIVDWQVLGWTIRWPDGAEDTLPGSGHQGVTTVHTLAPVPGGAGGARPVVAIAHLHVHGEALDFDGNAQLVPVTRDAFVDVSNDAGAVGAGAAPVYTPPQLRVGAVPASQLGDGSFPAPDFAQPPSAHAVAIRGRLLDLYPRAIVVQTGVETVGGVAVGDAVTTTTSWRFLGTATDAPAADATAPGTRGTTLQPVQVQYNHVERLDPGGGPIDEIIPLEITAHTVYPDGHAEDAAITQPVTVSIYYPALASPA